MNNTTITLTFGEQAENHRGMQVLGNGLVNTGFTISTLKKAEKHFKRCGYEAYLHYLCLDKEDLKENAAILIVRNGVEALINGTSDELLEEQLSLDWDTKAKMYGRVVNKRARHNLCYGEKAQKPDYENGKGTIVAWDDLTLTSQIRENLPTFLGRQAQNLQGEGNLYYDTKRCGIGFHGDSERRLVVAVRLGATIPLHFQWFYKGKPIGERMVFDLHHGDLYVMSDKATGHDWKLKNTATLRHAAGCDKFTTIK